MNSIGKVPSNVLLTASACIMDHLPQTGCGSFSYVPLLPLNQYMSHLEPNSIIEACRVFTELAISSGYGSSVVSTRHDRVPFTIHSYANANTTVLSTLEQKESSLVLHQTALYNLSSTIKLKLCGKELRCSDSSVFLPNLRIRYPFDQNCFFHAHQLKEIIPSCRHRCTWRHSSNSNDVPRSFL